MFIRIFLLNLFRHNWHCRLIDRRLIDRRLIDRRLIDRRFGVIFFFLKNCL